MQKLFGSATIFRLAVFLFVFGLAAGSAQAGSHGGKEGHKGGKHHHGHDMKDMTPEEMFDEHISHLSSKLDLTSEQIDQLRPIFRASFERKDDLKENKDAMSRSAYRDAKKAIHEDLMKGVDEVLTDEQRAIHGEMKKEHRKHRKGDSKRGYKGKDRGDKKDAYEDKGY